MLALDSKASLNPTQRDGMMLGHWWKPWTKKECNVSKTIETPPSRQALTIRWSQVRVLLGPPAHPPQSITCSDARNRRAVTTGFQSARRTTKVALQIAHTEAVGFGQVERGLRVRSA